MIYRSKFRFDKPVIESSRDPRSKDTAEAVGSPGTRHAEAYPE